MQHASFPTNSKQLNHGLIKYAKQIQLRVHGLLTKKLSLIGSFPFLLPNQFSHVSIQTNITKLNTALI